MKLNVFVIITALYGMNRTILICIACVLVGGGGGGGGGGHQG